MVKPKIKTVLFDAVGTLLYLAEPVGKTYAAMARRQGLEVEAEALNRSFIRIWKGLPQRSAENGPRVDDDRAWWRGIAVSTLEDACGDLGNFDTEEWFALLYTHFAEAGAWRVFPDVVPALEQLGRNYRMGVVSNFDRRLLGVLEGTGLLPYFDHIILSSEAGADKPDLEIFRIALKKMESVAEETLHVGDDPVRDLQGAKNAGLAAFCVKRPEITLANLISELP